MSRFGSLRSGLVAFVVLCVTVISTTPGEAQTNETILINELAASNDSFQDDFGETPDWIEIANTTDSPISLAGWTIGDSSETWTFPAVTIDANDIYLIWASDRDLAGPPLHTNFKLSQSGEPVTIRRPDGSISDSVVYPPISDGESWGVDRVGGSGILVEPTPGSPNSELRPSFVEFPTPDQAFVLTLDVAMSAFLSGTGVIRYTTDGSPVGLTSTIYDDPITITASTSFRAAVESAGELGPEAVATYLAISDDLVGRTSDLPIVLVNSARAIGDLDSSAVVSVIDRGPDGRASITGTPDYSGFAGLRLRGNSSARFPKKQYKFELWENTSGDSRRSDLLGLGEEDDWALYAPGRYDRAMINNPFIYELGHSIGVPAPDYKFVELWLQESPQGTIGTGQYQGIYLLRETITIDENRIDITEPAPTTSGPDTGFIVRHDRTSECCSQIYSVPGAKIAAVVEPSPDEITPAQLSYIDGFWDDMRAAANSRDIDRIRQFIDIEQFIDYWLILMLAKDPDAWRYSTYFFKEANQPLRAGPLWDYDRTMGSDDERTDSLSDARGWLNEIDFTQSLWATPEIQAQLRARWAELRTNEFSDATLTAKMYELRDEITESYPRELTVWNGGDYGPRQGDGLNGEVEYMREWIGVRLGWLDQSLSSTSQTQITNPGPVTVAAGDPVDIELEATGGSAHHWAAEGLPTGLEIDPNTGRITGVVGLGDAQIATVELAVTNNQGAAAEDSFELTVAAAPAGPIAIVLNEFNAVSGAQLLGGGGADPTFGPTVGNGGDWFELVTVVDHLDLRGWRFDLISRQGDALELTHSLSLGNDERLADLRAGTIVTVAESVADDLSYDPAAGDWTLNFQADDDGQGAVWSDQSNFGTNDDDWRLVVRDSNGDIRAPIAGETAQWGNVNGDLGPDQVLLLDSDPAPTVNPADDYSAGTASTFGAPNVVSAGGLQDFSALRPAVSPPGDVNCDGLSNVVDSLMISQFAVDNRSGAACPLDTPGTLNLETADMNGDTRVDVVDALVIALCSVGVTNPLCSS